MSSGRGGKGYEVGNRSQEEEEEVEDEEEEDEEVEDEQKEDEEIEDAQRRPLTMHEYFRDVDSEMNKLISFEDCDSMCYNGNNVLVQDSWDLPVILTWPESTVKISCSVDIGDVYFSLQFVPAPEEGQELEDVDVRTVVERTKVQSRESAGKAGNDEYKDFSATFEFDAPCEGIMLAVFDNTDDWWSNKHISYSIVVAEPAFRICDEDRAFFCHELLRQVSRNLEIDNLLMADSLDSLAHNEEVAHAQEQDMGLLGNALLSRYEELQLLLAEKEELESFVQVSTEAVQPGLRIRSLDRFALLRVFQFLTPAEIKPVCCYWNQLTCELEEQAAIAGQGGSLGYTKFNIDALIRERELQSKLLSRQERQVLVASLKEAFNLAEAERLEQEQREKELKMQRQKELNERASSKSVRIVGKERFSTSPDKAVNRESKSKTGAVDSRNSNTHNRTDSSKQAKSTTTKNSNNSVVGISTSDIQRHQQLSQSKKSGDPSGRSQIKGQIKGQKKGQTGQDSSDSGEVPVLIRDPRDKGRERGPQRSASQPRANRVTFASKPTDVVEFLSPVEESRPATQIGEVKKQSGTNNGNGNSNSKTNHKSSSTHAAAAKSNINNNNNKSNSNSNNKMNGKQGSSSGDMSTFYSPEQINQINIVDYIRKEVTVLERLLGRRKEIKGKIRDWNEVFEVEQGRKASDREKDISIRHLYEDFKTVSLKYTVRCDRFDESLKELNLDHEDVDKIRFGSMADALMITLRRMEMRPSSDPEVKAERQARSKKEAEREGRRAQSSSRRGGGDRAGDDRNREGRNDNRYMDRDSGIGSSRQHSKESSTSNTNTNTNTNLNNAEGSRRGGAVRNAKMK